MIKWCPTAGTANRQPCTPVPGTRVKLGGGSTDPDKAVPLDHLATSFAAGALADELVEPVARQALVQQSALIDGEVEPSEQTSGIITGDDFGGQSEGQNAAGEG